ncbi:Fe-S oxidoreductase [Candidatus Magnetomorum sp. HK-1]|nr:Fe-S oxidoreductase [Candidatus Magnetomorum sp. HK-1]
MKNLEISKTKTTPEINFNNSTHELVIKGESYPENTSEFYAPVFEWLDNYLESITGQSVVVNIELMYFNSSSSKVLMDLFDMLEENVQEGKNITVNWRYDEENEMAVEYGEDFMEDLEALPFNLVQV